MRRQSAALDCVSERNNPRTVRPLARGRSKLALVIYIAAPRGAPIAATGPSVRDSWRMPPLTYLTPRHLITLNRAWLPVLRAYLIVAAGLVLVLIVTLATSGDRPCPP
jgi:hypothetical protein